MTHAGEPLNVDADELLVSAERIDGHASEFRAVQAAVQSRAGSVVLGSGSAAAALPKMLAAWEADGVRFDEHFVRQARDHRNAAAAYSQTDADGANEIDECR